MGLGKFLRKLPVAYRQRRSCFSAAGSPLTFKVLGILPERTFETDAIRFRSIGINDGTLLYSICPGALSPDELRIAESTKAMLINKMVNDNDMHAVAFKDVLKMTEELVFGKVPKDRIHYLSYLVAHDVGGQGAISILLDDSEEIEEIEINSPFSIAVYHRRYGRCSTNLQFCSKPDFRYTINRIAASAGKELGAKDAILDMQFGIGRLHAQLGPYAISGGAASIRLGRLAAMTPDEMIALKFSTKEAFSYLSSAVAKGANIIICGAPGTGKTTLLSAISSFIPNSMRVITIEEEISEVVLSSSLRNVVKLKGSERDGVGFREQIRNALHMRPEMLVIGEIRGAEANDAFSGANLGIPFITTMHSSQNGQALLDKLESNPLNVERALLNRLDISVFLSKRENGSRIIESIIEYRWPSSKESGVGMLPIVEKGNVNAGAIRLSRVVNDGEARADALPQTVSEGRRSVAGHAVQSE